MIGLEGTITCIAYRAEVGDSSGVVERGMQSKPYGKRGRS